MRNLFLIVVFGLVVLNVLTCVKVFRSPRYDSRQKTLQAVFVWVIPFVGAVLAWSLAHDAPVPRINTDLADRYGFDDGNMRLENHGVDAGGDGGGGE